MVSIELLFCCVSVVDYAPVICLTASMWADVDLGGLCSVFTGRLGLRIVVSPVQFCHMPSKTLLRVRSSRMNLKAHVSDISQPRLAAAHSKI